MRYLVVAINDEYEGDAFDDLSLTVEGIRGIESISVADDMVADTLVDSHGDIWVHATGERYFPLERGTNVLHETKADIVRNYGPIRKAAWF